MNTCRTIFTTRVQAQEMSQAVADIDQGLTYVREMNLMVPDAKHMLTVTTGFYPERTRVYS